MGNQEDVYGIENHLLRQANNRIQLTVKSVTFFAKQKNAPLFTSADAGVRLSAYSASLPEIKSTKYQKIGVGWVQNRFFKIYRRAK
jgi:hypothetical protein